MSIRMRTNKAPVYKRFYRGKVAGSNSWMSEVKREWVHREGNQEGTGEATETAGGHFHLSLLSDLDKLQGSKLCLTFTMGNEQAGTWILSGSFKQVTTRNSKTPLPSSWSRKPRRIEDPFLDQKKKKITQAQLQHKVEFNKHRERTVPLPCLGSLQRDTIPFLV